MASDTLAEIRAAAYDRADISVDDPRVPVATMDRFINAALRKASTTFDPFWLETSASLSTVAAQNYVALSGLTGFHKMSRVTQGTDILKQISKHEIAEYLVFSNQKPTAWAIEDEKLILGPTPDAVYSLTCYYYRLEDALSDEGDQPLLPAQYTDWLVIESAILASTKKRDEEMIRELRRQKQEWFQNIRDDIRQVRGLPRIRTKTWQ